MCNSQFFTLLVTSKFKQVIRNTPVEMLGFIRRCSGCYEHKQVPVEIKGFVLTCFFSDFTDYLDNGGGPYFLWTFRVILRQIYIK